MTNTPSSSIIPADAYDTSAYWQALKTAIYKACTDSIGYTTHQHQDWFDENDVEIEVLLHRKRPAFCALEISPFFQQKYDAYHQVKAEAQRKICDIKNRWCQAKALKIQHFVDHHNMRNFLKATKAIYDPSSNGLTTLRSQDGSILLKDDVTIKQRWKAHFNTHLNHESTVQGRIQKFRK